jgi:hypothetical protein
MNGQLHDWWARERMRDLHDEAARRALVRCLRRPLSLTLGHLLERVGRALARGASSCRPPERLAAALNGALAARHARGLARHG